MPTQASARMPGSFICLLQYCAEYLRELQKVDYSLFQRRLKKDDAGGNKARPRPECTSRNSSLV
jgi:hypothetical protein